jgi:hypothetical protein
VQLPSRGAGIAGMSTRRRCMSLTKEVKLEIVEKHGRGPADTGSAEVQVALLTRRINDLTEHLRRTYAHKELYYRNTRPQGAMLQEHAVSR